LSPQDSQLDPQRFLRIIPHQTSRSTEDGLEVYWRSVQPKHRRAAAFSIRDEGQLFRAASPVIDVDDAWFDSQTSSRPYRQRATDLGDIGLPINLGHNAGNDWRPGRCLDKLHPRMVLVSNF
jgi:hypothetical protein